MGSHYSGSDPDPNEIVSGGIIIDEGSMVFTLCEMDFPDNNRSGKVSDPALHEELSNSGVVLEPACAEDESPPLVIETPQVPTFADLGHSTSSSIVNYVNEIDGGDPGILVSVAECADVGSKVTDPNDTFVGSNGTDAEANDNDLGSKVVTDPNVNNLGSTDADDKGHLDTVTDTNDKYSIDADLNDNPTINPACSKYADLIDRNSKVLWQLQVQAACNPGNEALVARANVACRSHWGLLRQMMVLQGASSSVLAAFNNVNRYLFSYQRKWKKYHFFRTLPDSSKHK